MKSPIILAIAGLTALIGGNALADPVAVHVLLTPTEQMKFEFADGSKHFRPSGSARGKGRRVWSVRWLGRHRVRVARC
jgi:hypothetical protein